MLERQVFEPLPGLMFLRLQGVGLRLPTEGDRVERTTREDLDDLDLDFDDADLERVRPLDDRGDTGLLALD